MPVMPVLCNTVRAVLSPSLALALENPIPERIDPRDTTVSLDRSLSPLPTVPIERFKTVRVLGSGGCGTVHSAWDKELRREVALKVITQHDNGDPSLEGSHREALVTNRIKGPGIPQVFGIGVCDLGPFY